MRNYATLKTLTRVLTTYAEVKNSTYVTTLVRTQDFSCTVVEDKAQLSQRCCKTTKNERHGLQIAAFGMCREVEVMNINSFEVSGHNLERSQT